MCLMHTRFFFHSPPTTEIYTLSLHDALPICDTHLDAGDRHGCAIPGIRRLAAGGNGREHGCRDGGPERRVPEAARPRDRKSTRLNSSHVEISYAVFCLKKKKHILMF